MKKIALLLFLLLVLSGCSTYKYQRGQPPYDKGYVVSRDDYVIPEYTLGKDDSVPGIKVAKDRFKRRRRIVEDYYKRMGYIEDKIKQNFWDPPFYLMKLIGGIFRLPFIALSGYKYDHNPKYREKVTQREEEELAKEKRRIEDLKKQLYAYIQKDLSKEPPEAAKSTIPTISPLPTPAPPKPLPPPSAPKAKAPTLKTPAPPAPTIPTSPPLAPITPAPPASKPEVVKVKPQVEPVAEREMLMEQKIEELAPIVEEKPAEAKPQPVATEEEIKPPIPAPGPVAVIIAKPTKGFSPLKVNFSGAKSYSTRARIIAYEWDFGDGDTSTKANPTNTFFSTTYGSRPFTVILTVKDSKGRTSSASAVIEVLNK